MCHSYSKLKWWTKGNIKHESPHLTFLSQCPVLTINEHVSINIAFLRRQQWTKNQRANWQLCIILNTSIWRSQTLTLIFNFLFQFETQSHKEDNNVLFKGSKFFERAKSQVGIVYPSALPFETSGDFQVQVPLHSLVIHSTCNFGVLYFNIGWAPNLTKYPWMQNCKM